MFDYSMKKMCILINYMKKLINKTICTVAKLKRSVSMKIQTHIRKTFLNNKNIYCIPQLLHRDKFVIDFKEKANIFNNFFAKQSSIVSNNSELPVPLTRKTHESLSTIDFSTEDILKIIRNLNPNKAQGHHMISIRMIKISDTSICRPLKLIFQACLESGKFPMNRKKRMWFQFTKKVTSKY